MEMFIFSMNLKTHNLPLNALKLKMMSMLSKKKRHMKKFNKKLSIVLVFFLTME